MGILDQKTRIFDTILTVQGREQLAQGKFRGEYYSFSDSGAVYLEDTVVSGSGLGLTDRLVLEAGSVPQDQVTFEADDSGNLIAGKALDQVYSGSLFRYVAAKGGTITGDGTKLTATDFASVSSRLLESSFQNWRNLQILGSPDRIDERFDEFQVSNPSLTFQVLRDRPIPESGVQVIGVDEVESLWQDKRLSHIPNFLYLPPVNRPRLGYETRAPLGDWVNTQQQRIQGWEDLQEELEVLEATGYKQEVRFTETSRENNLFSQWFELESGAVVKLDVIDFGEFFVSGDMEHPTRHVFFVGKVYTDSLGTSTFVNLFTMVWK